MKRLTFDELKQADQLEDYFWLKEPLGSLSSKGWRPVAICTVEFCPGYELGFYVLGSENEIVVSREDIENGKYIFVGPIPKPDNNG